MKTAISIPDPIFLAAEQLAQSLGITRSELYAKAIHLLVSQYDDNEITERLNRIYSFNKASSIHPQDTELELASINEEQW